LFKLNSLDRLGHMYGPSSAQIEQRVKYLDEQLNTLFNKLDKNVVFIIMSDHGMVPVLSKNDLIGFLNKRGHTMGLDYFAFVGATYTSFWFRNEDEKNSIISDLNKLSFGKVLSNEEKSKLGLCNLGYEYGEIIFVNNDSSVTFPEFYHKRSFPKGMHGYAFSKYDSPIFLLHNGQYNSQNTITINFVDILPTILKLFDVPIPPNLDGKALL